MYYIQSRSSHKIMVISITVQSRSIVFYYILCTVFEKDSTYLPDIFHLDIWKSYIHCFKNLLYILWGSEKNSIYTAWTNIYICTHVHILKFFKLAVSPQLALQHVKEAFTNILSSPILPHKFPRTIVKLKIKQIKTKQSKTSNYK